MVEIPPGHNKMLGVYNQESATTAELDLIEGIVNPTPTAPFSSISDRKLQAIRKLEEIFKQTTYKHEDRF